MVASMLNNRAYSGQINNYGITKLCFTYGAVAVRFIGTVNAEKDETQEGAKVSLNTYCVFGIVLESQVSHFKV